MNNEISIIAPSKNIDGFKDQFDKGLEILISSGFKIAFDQTAEIDYSNFNNKIDIINNTLESGASITWCAVGGDSCFDILDSINYDKIASDKLLIGSSDNTHLVLAVYLKTAIKTIFGPNVVNLSNLRKKSINQCLDYIRNIQKFEYPKEMTVIKPGKTSGVLFGGNLFALNNTIEKYPVYSLENIILFFEEIEDEVSNIKREIERLKSSAIIGKINGLVIGNLISKNSDEIIAELVKSEFAEFNFPIAKVNYFGHNVKEFYPLPIGVEAHLDTSKNLFALI